MDKNELSYWMALAHLEGMSTRRKMEIIVSCYYQKKNLSDFFRADNNSKISDFAISNPDGTENQLTQVELDCIGTLSPQIPNYAFMAESLQEQGYGIITVMDKEYPKQLKKMMGYTSPLVIYTKGDVSLLNQDAIAIVGSRKAKDISLQFTDTIARKEVEQGKIVVSGYAKGVDRQALDSALAGGGKSIVVLPQGITTFGSGYRQLYKELTSGRVLIMSYFHPDAGWSVGLAMARNTVVYGLAKEIFVAESDNHGGTWSGVMSGLKYNSNEKNKEKLAIYVRIPGDKEKNANLELINMGAEPITLTGEVKKREDVIEDFSAIENKIISLLRGNSLRPETIIEKCGLSWTKQRMVGYLDTLKDKGVEKVKVGRYNCYTIKVDEPDLFN